MTMKKSKGNTARLGILDNFVREIINQEQLPHVLLGARLQLLGLWFAYLHFDELELFLFIVDQES